MKTHLFRAFIGMRANRRIRGSVISILKTHDIRE